MANMLSPVTLLTLNASGYPQAVEVDAPLPVGDFWIDQAIREIESTYGDVVSVQDKNKSLGKFGRTSNADNGVKTTVATLELSLRTASASWADIMLKPYIVIPPNTDVRMVATSNTNDTTVSGRIAGILALVTS